MQNALFMILHSLDTLALFTTCPVPAMLIIVQQFPPLTLVYVERELSAEHSVSVHSSRTAPLDVS